MNKKIVFFAAAFVMILAAAVSARSPVFFKLPPLPPPELYGNLLIDRASTASGVKPVTFSHWSHRVKYTCMVCHFELEFDLMVNSTEITEEMNRYGRYCGACHDNKTAFGHTEEHCEKCHNGDIGYGKEKLAELVEKLPPAPRGNGIDWIKAVEDKVISPVDFVLEETPPFKFEREIVLQSPWAGISPVHFPHNRHGEWLHCSNCHPEIFGIKHESTEDLAMESVLEYDFCGVCHGRVSFPPNDNCNRCHPKMRNRGITPENTTKK